MMIMIMVSVLVVAMATVLFMVVFVPCCLMLVVGVLLWILCKKETPLPIGIWGFTIEQFVGTFAATTRPVYACTCSACIYIQLHIYICRVIVNINL